MKLSYNACLDAIFDESENGIPQFKNWVNRVNPRETHTFSVQTFRKMVSVCLGGDKCMLDIVACIFVNVFLVYVSSAHVFRRSCISTTYLF